MDQRSAIVPPLLTWICLILWMEMNQFLMKKQESSLLRIQHKSEFLLFCSTASSVLSVNKVIISSRWAAYVAGTILVLMIELGVRFEDSISLLVRFFSSFC